MKHKFICKIEDVIEDNIIFKNYHIYDICENCKFIRWINDESYKLANDISCEEYIIKQLLE